MKNILILLISCLFLLGSCKNSPNDTGVKADEKTVEDEKSKSKKMVDDFITAYDNYFAEYQKAKADQDDSRIKELGGLAKNLYVQADSTLKTVLKEDSIRLQGYLNKKMDELVQIK